MAAVLSRGDRDEFRRRAALDHAVGMVFRRQPPPGVAHLLHARARQQAEHGIGIVRVRAEIGGLDAAEFEFR